MVLPQLLHGIRPCATLQEAARQQWEEEKAQLLQDSERGCREQVAEVQSQAQEELLAVQAEAQTMWVDSRGSLHSCTAANDHRLCAVHYICSLHIPLAWQRSGAHMQPYDQVHLVSNKAQVTAMCIEVDVA